MTATPMTGFVIEAMRNIELEAIGFFDSQIHHALCRVVHHLAFARDDRDGACQVAGGNAALDHLVDASEALGRQPDFFRLAGRRGCQRR